MRDTVDVQSNLRLLKIDIVECSFETPDGFKGGDLNYGSDITVEYKVDNDKPLIAVKVKVILEHRDSESQMARLVAVHLFELAEELWQSCIDGVPESLAKTINKITIGSARGMMAYAFKGTFLHTAIVPILHDEAIVV